MTHLTLTQKGDRFVLTGVSNKNHWLSGCIGTRYTQPDLWVLNQNSEYTMDIKRIGPIKTVIAGPRRKKRVIASLTRRPTPRKKK